jgi:hypothetical protein
MKLIITLALGLLALGTVSDSFARCFGCNRGGSVATERNCAKCPPPPCCVKTVEVRVPAKKIVECDCHWVCPTECETKQSDYRINDNY